MKDDSDEDEKIALISHVSNNDRLKFDSGFSHHMTGDTSKFKKLEHYNRSRVKFGNDAPCYMKGKGSIKPNEMIKCDNAYWVDGSKYKF